MCESYDILSLASSRNRVKLYEEEISVKKGLIRSSLSIVISVFLTLSSFSISSAMTPQKEAAGDSYVPQSEIKNAGASSFQAGYEPMKAFDGVENDANNCWHTPWGEDMVDFPHWIMAEFQNVQTIDALVYIPRSETDYQFVTKYEVWISPDADEAHLQKVSEGEWPRGKNGISEFPAQEAKLVKFVILEKTDANNNPEDHSVSASEIKFKLNLDVAGAYDPEILQTGARAAAVLAYAKDLLGAGEYDMDAALFDALQAENVALQKLLHTKDSQIILKQIDKVEDAIVQLLSSNKTDEENLYVDIPQSIMTVSANSSNAGYLPERAIDGNTGTIWHSEWTPANDPFPHIFTIDLHKSMLLKDIRISPRQDMSSGKTTSGQIFAGDSLSDMRHVIDFTGDTSKAATVVDLNYTKARYVQIYSLKATSENTAISEISVSTFDRALAGAYSLYDHAVDLLRKAVVGENIGDFTAEDKNAFQKEVDSFKSELQKDEIAVEGYYAISEKIGKACRTFVSKAKTYGKPDLDALIKSLKEQVLQTAQPGDRERAEAVLKKAEKLYADTNAPREDIHAMCVEGNDFMKSMNAQDNKACDLSGQWNLALQGYSGDLEPTAVVTLPGTLDTNKEGVYNAFDDISRLSRYYTYTGPATYQKEVYVCEEWAGQNIVLYMERSRETRVWVNGTEVVSPETSNVLPVSQQYDITANLKFGEYNTIAIVVDNSYPHLPSNPVGGSHMATEETQTNWNGILGRFSLLLREPVCIDDLRVYPNADLKTVKIEADIQNNTEASYQGKLAFTCAGANQRKADVALAAGERKTITLSDFAMPADTKLWSEFDRPLYTMTASLDNGSSSQERFGMRSFRSEENSLTINGDKVFLRSEANCAVFPLTGYAPMDEAGWEKLFGTYQSYGINAVRFHSWCPPEAAFNVADRLGLYLQPELSCWDGGMFSDETKKTYYTKEAFAILKEYANHPSFVMFSFGNELQYQGDTYEYADALLGKLKEKDATRLYAPGSNVQFSSANPTPNTDYYTSQAFWGTPLRGIYGGMGGFINQEYPSTTVNYSDAVNRIAAFGVPTFSFEVGQFQVFPDILRAAAVYRRSGSAESQNDRRTGQGKGNDGRVCGKSHQRLGYAFADRV